MENKRCKHCQDYYLVGGVYDFYDDNFCINCVKIIKEALSNIPVKYENRLHNIKEIELFKQISLQQILTWEKEDHVKYSWYRCFRFICKSRVDSSDGKNHWNEHVRLVSGKDQYKSFIFCVSTWPEESKYANEYSIWVVEEFDLVEQKFTGNFWLIFK